MKNLVICVACTVAVLGCESVKTHPTPPMKGTMPPPQGVTAIPEPAMQPVPTYPPATSVAPLPAVQRDPYLTYRAFGGPRVAVYVTRHYGSRINDWQSDSKTVTKTQSTETSREGTTTHTTSGQLSVYTRAPDDQPLSTQGSRRLERGLVNRLVSQGVTVVDPDMILREEAAKHRVVDSTNTVILSREMVEQYALRNNVAYLLTTDLERIHDDCSVIEGLAQIKVMSTNTILASLSTAEIETQEMRQVYVTTNRGYEKASLKTILDCEEVATLIADVLMSRLGGG